MGGGGGGFGGQQNWDFKSNIDPEELFRTIFGNKAGVYILKNYIVLFIIYTFIILLFNYILKKKKKNGLSVCVLAEKNSIKTHHFIPVFVYQITIVN